MLSLENVSLHNLIHTPSLFLQHANSKTVSYRTLPAPPQPSPPENLSASHPTVTTAPAPPHTPHPPHPTHTHPTPTYPSRTLPASPQPNPPIGPSTSHPTISTAPAPRHAPHAPHPTHTHPTPIRAAPPTAPSHPRLPHWDHFWANVVAGDPFSTNLLGYDMDGTYEDLLARCANQRALRELVDLHMNSPFSVYSTANSHQMMLV